MKRCITLILVCTFVLVSCADVDPKPEKWDFPPMVMIDGVLYLDTGHTDTGVKKCGTYDGEILSSVDGSERPSENNQSNFGTGYGYRFTPTEGIIEIYMNSKWRIFATEDQREKIQFPEKNNEIVLKSPPELTVVRHDSSVVATRGTTSWMYKNDDGTITGIESDSLHPLQTKEHMTPLYLHPSAYSRIDPYEAYLQWDHEPDLVTVRVWSEECWGQYDAPGEDISAEAMVTDFQYNDDGTSAVDYMISLKDGNYIYEVIAEWNYPKNYGGVAHYSFYTIKPELKIIPIE